MAHANLTNSLQENLGRFYHVRGVVCVVLFVYCLFSHSQWRYNNSKYKKLTGTINVMKQMRSYAKERCNEMTKTGSSGQAARWQYRHKSLRKEQVSKLTTEREVTFVLLGPTLNCLQGMIRWFVNHHRNAKILIALHLGIETLHTLTRREQSMHFLGGFANVPEALNYAIPLVDTPYFMLINYEVGLSRMPVDFAERLLSNVQGFDVLGGALVDGKGEFSIPCHHLQMSHWKYTELMQYNISDNFMQCDATSLPFLGRTGTFKKIKASNVLFDTKLPLKWLEDFFFRYKKTLKVAVLPEVIVQQNSTNDCFKLENSILSRSETVEMLIPFAKKHQLFYMENKSSMIDICTESRSLPCSEHFMLRNWTLPNWIEAGLTTYPFILQSLEKALLFGARRLEEEGLMYVLEGGTLLGLVRQRGILPWDHGDIDTFVYATRRKVINMVKRSLRNYGYEFWLRHTGFHTYVTDDPSSWNGCIVYLTRRVKPKEVTYIRNKGKLYPMKREVFTFLRNFYGSSFLETHTKYSDQRSHCLIPGHHACMPDCRWNGCGGGGGGL